MPASSTAKITSLVPARFARDANYFNHTTKENDHGDHC
jgi:hypothetical protein